MSSAVMNFSPAEREALLSGPRFAPGPPVDAQALVDRAWDIAQLMAGEDRQLHFEDGAVELRTLDGDVLCELSAAEAVEIMCRGLDAA